MTLYNVKASIVELVEAGSTDEAIAILRQRINNAGLTVYDSPNDAPDAFESEAQPHTTHTEGTVKTCRDSRTDQGTST